ncbi:hypothetical protein Pla100_35170 [Neorhodopirellula pilleata]|uniref:Uncharacterized protein n=1 Tax=Neorhodopirellula pilleata TaxID=2714738 RepID=A0A5C6A6M9_9BACT|nr:hypothetical protein Pla100_35170 [Neorhodopirellula pilleata]
MVHFWTDGKADRLVIGPAIWETYAKLLSLKSRLTQMASMLRFRGFVYDFGRSLIENAIFPV